MALLRKKLSATKKALLTFQEALSMPSSQIVQDSSIQRFEYTLDLFWKTVKEALSEWEGKDAFFPKAAFRAWGVVMHLSPEEIEVLLTMVDDRNLTAHTYDDKTVKKIFQRLPGYAACMARELERIDLLMKDTEK